MGGSTGLIGDPSGRNVERNQLRQEEVRLPHHLCGLKTLNGSHGQVNSNATKISKQLQALVPGASTWYAIMFSTWHPAGGQLHREDLHTFAWS